MKPSKKVYADVHFIGIGGIGMSGLARYFMALSKGSKGGPKWTVSGSDAARSTMTDELIKEGITVKIGHKAGNIGRNDGLVIYNRAIPLKNLELAAARKKKAILMPYAKVLGRITKNYSTIAITGSHGKSTTTALAGLALMAGGLDPTILVGTKLRELKGKNIRVGKGPHLVLEADDYGGAFMEYSPTISIVTNIDKEHMDFYKNFGNVKKAFLKFLSNTRKGGLLILNKDDAPLFSLKKQIARIAKKNKLDVTWYSLRNPAAAKIKRVIKIPGQHNVSNSLAVFELGRALKISEKNVLAAIGSYNGAWRRMEHKGSLKKFGAPDVLVYDDYAHHPTEIKATLQGFREKYPRSPLICVFQPHQAQRLELLFKEFTAAFDDADIVAILPLYKVLGRDEKLPHDSAALVNAMKKRSPKKWIMYIADPKNLKTELRSIIEDLPVSGSSKKTRVDSPVLVMMGAGDIANLTTTLLK
jgi:UDP-N-acetylmuramate--alanine ligase